LVRENTRLFFHEARYFSGFDINIIARKPAGNLQKEGSFTKVGGSLAQLFRRLGIV
jgi:hypothetical protein